MIIIKMILSWIASIETKTKNIAYTLRTVFCRWWSVFRYVINLNYCNCLIGQFSPFSLYKFKLLNLLTRVWLTEYINCSHCKIARFKLNVNRTVTIESFELRKYIKCEKYGRFRFDMNSLSIDLIDVWCMFFR